MAEKGKIEKVVIEAIIFSVILFVALNILAPFATENYGINPPILRYALGAIFIGFVAALMKNYYPGTWWLNP